MEWTTHFAQGRAERSLPGIVIDAVSLDGIDIAAERSNRVQIVATSGAPLDAHGTQDLGEFLDVAARVLGRCAAGTTIWTALVLTVRAESGSIGAFLVDEADGLARSGALVALSLPSLEEAAAELPWADEDPVGFETAGRALKERIRNALASAASTEPAATSVAALLSSARLRILFDPVGETDPADCEPLVPVAGGSDLACDRGDHPR